MPNIVLPKPHAGQLPIYRDSARYRVLACGRRFGKTELEKIEAVKAAIAGGKPVGWFAPHYKYLAEPYRDLRQCLAPVTTKRNHNRFIELNNGSRIDFWTLDDEDAGRGHKYGLAVIDEAGMVPGLGDVWNEAIRPTLTDYAGRAIFAGTPKGRNFFAELFQRGRDGLEGWSSHHMPTSANPTIPKAEYDQAKLLAEGLPERAYRQEYMAEFLDDAGGVFVGVADAVDAGRFQNEPPKKGVRYVAGIDLAQTEDWTVVVIFDGDGRQVYFDRFQRLSWALTVERCANALELYSASCVIDATGVGQPIFEAIRQKRVRVEPFKFTQVSKAGLVESAVAAIQRGDIRLMDIKTQTDELQAFEYEVTRTGNVRMSAPMGIHDDCVIAVCLAVKALTRPVITAY